MRLGWKRKRGFFLKAGRLKPAALDSIDDLLVDQEAGELLDQASRPPRLLHTQARPGCVEVKSVDLPGVRLELGPPPRTWWQTLPGGGVRPLPDDQARRWLEELPDGTIVPLGTAHILAWARDRSRS